MANTYYDSQLTAAEIETALEAIDGVIVPANNGKALYIENGKISAKSVTSGGASLQSKTATPSASQIVVQPDSGYDGLSTVTVEGVVAPNLIAGNIKKDVVIKVGTSTDDDSVMTVTGSYEGSGGGGSTIIVKPDTITQNGTYYASADNADGYSQVVVSVSGGGGVPLLSRSGWNALSTAQKQSYGLVAIQDYVTGFERGVLVNGADYVPVGQYIPYSDELKVICEAYPSIFDANSLVWGDGNTQLAFSALGSSLNSQEAAVYIPVQSNGIIASLDLGAVDTPFTAYVVMKGTNTGSGRLISCLEQNNTSGSNKGILMDCRPNVYVSSWANDTDTGISGTNYFAAALQFASPGNALGYVYGGSALAKPTTTCNRYITLGRTNEKSSSTVQNPNNIYVRYFAVVNEAETEQTIASNLANLYSHFIGS